MKLSRKKFIRTTALIGAGAAITTALPKSLLSKVKSSSSQFPIIISTWNHGLKANETALNTLNSGGTSLDAVEQGIKTAENDPKVTSVGYGGYPDAEGNVTLDACIMDWNGNAGGVAFLQEIKNPISVARLVMEKTSHVLLVGDGALEFAVENRFQKENLLTDTSLEWWKKKKEGKDAAMKHHKTNEDHDTIGQIVIDTERRIAGGVSTSGLGFKLPGRVGDSPIIGAGLYVDNEAGAACATGLGELAMKSLGCFFIVEKMRDGFSPMEACRLIINRIHKKYKTYLDTQLAFLAIDKNGYIGAYALREGFTYCVSDERGTRELQSEFLIH